MPVLQDSNEGSSCIPKDELKELMPFTQNTAKKICGSDR